ncbi:MAG: glycosyltransferase [Clostridium sp.]|nr:glycosyltransferase [Clostridium sp.]MCM1444143.1 glycosyltransferase [Candidatus Amulumruptor caecigallinarius]
MRIGIFTDTYPPYINGVSTSILMLQHALEKLGHTVYIVTVNAEKMAYKYENEDKIIRIPGILTGIYDYRLTGIYPLKIVSKIKKWNLDVIHTHSEFSVGIFARIIAKQFSIPIVHTYHTLYEDYVHYITKGYFDKSSKKIVEYLTKFYCDKTATELIVPTKKIYNLFKEKYKIDKNIHIVPTGIEIERFYRENYNQKEIDAFKKSLGFKKSDFIILSVSRIAQEKNVPLLLDAQEEIYKKHKNCKLLIVGDGPDLESLKEKYKENKSITFVGKVPYEEVVKYYLVANIFATASRTETQGLTVIEASAASIVPICIEDESFLSVIIDDLNGRIFKDKKEYIKIIDELILDKSKLKRLSNQARISSDAYSSKYYAQRVIDVYNVAINSYKNKKKFFKKAKKEEELNEK